MVVRSEDKRLADELALAILEETDGYVQLADDQALRVVRNLSLKGVRA